MRALRILLGVSLVLAGTGLVLYGFSNSEEAGAQPYTRTVTNTVPLSATGAVHLENHEGTIQVRTWSRGEVQYEVQFVSETDEQAPHNADLRVVTGPESIRLRPDLDDLDRTWKINLQGIRRLDAISAVHITVTVPARASLDIADHASDIDLDGLGGALRLDTHEGSVSVRNHEGAVHIDAHDSPIRLDDIAGDVRLDLHDADVRAEGIAGAVDVDAHEGDLDLHFAALRAPVDVETHDADLVLRLPRNASFDLFTNFSDDDADLDADFALDSVRIQTGNDEDEVDYRGAVNGGGPRIALRGHDPDVRLYTK